MSLDSLSMRNPVHVDWALDHGVFPVVVAHFGLSPVIDLLVTPLNSQLPVFISPVPDLAAFGTDTLSVPWDWFKVVYDFPPWH